MALGRGVGVTVRSITTPAVVEPGIRRRPALSARLLRNRSVVWSGLVLATIGALAAAAPLIAHAPPQLMDAANIHRAVGEPGGMILPGGTKLALRFWMGTDGLGRDLFSRVIHGSRISLIVGFSCALIALLAGMVLGMMAGYFRAVDAILMRVIDGLMAIPGILLAIALVAALGPRLEVVVVAIAVPEVPRVARLVRSLVLSLREEPFVEAARTLATPPMTILVRHILPNASAPLLIQGTFIAASAIITEAALSFLGLGLPPEIPTWGNIMAEGRRSFSEFPGAVLFPALLLFPTVLAVNLLGDGLRDVLDPKFSRRGAQ